ncbi:MAG: glycine--tRNA ligase subunit alpha, partial [Spirochaetota bacterium]
ISLELTYGLERIAMFIQGKENVFDIMWNDRLTYGDLRRREELEFSTYNFEKASVEKHARLFNDFEDEARLCLREGLVLPAYDMVIKCSHTFNMLDARGALSVTERTAYIARVRALAREVAESYIESRRLQGFPLLGEGASRG